MERDRLTALSMDDLRQEALRHQLPATADREVLIEAISAHLSLDSPTDEMMPSASGSRTTTGKIRKGSGSADRRGSNNRDLYPQGTFPRAGGSGADSFSSSQYIIAGTSGDLVSTANFRSGTDEENVHIWSQRVDRVAQVHHASEDVVLLAASSKLTKLAKQWYEMQSGHVLESWYELKQAMIKMFDRRVSFTAAMQKIEARKWNPAKESFDQYSIDKLTLIHRLDLPSTDAINLIIGGIPQHSLRATALALTTQSVDKFLEAMRRITYGMGDMREKNHHQSKAIKKDYKAADGKTQGHKDRPTKGACNYCKKEGHWKSDCPLLKKKERTVATASSSSPAPEKTSSSTQPTAAAVEDNNRDKFYLSGPLIIIDKINNIDCNLSALMDTGSPVSFVSLSNFQKFFNCTQTALEPVDRKFNALPKNPINVQGKINSVISFKSFPDRTYEVCLHVVDSDFSEMDLIIGRDFLENYNLTLIFRPTRSDSTAFTQLLLQSDVCYTEMNAESLLDECEIDFGLAEKQQLKEVVLDCLNTEVKVIDDDYYVSVNLKDHSTYAFAPRKFALEERKQIRAITDDLLERGIIRNSTSPYCARIVPVRKKNGNLRLCVDLRPLNARILKQKYPFPLIEDCLAQLSDRAVFTLLDLKDGFHQIKVKPQHTKYFSFATPDGQFEYVRLPFGFSEAPAEFKNASSKFCNRSYDKIKF
ncbi:uncharacterized protein LOC114934906 [Nylanderia fulva]|uniref:uncharacterized protein LOC114934906 n=1 Tax=Nylanderia fulva TaxID=613905 RepID=UPI0010FB0271|nr:uncharacterized protein LOC114934906 [Nylanderia fulva]